MKSRAKIANVNAPSLLHCPRWPRQVQSCVTVADGFANNCRQCKRPVWTQSVVMEIAQKSWGGCRFSDDGLMELWYVCMLGWKVRITIMVHRDRYYQRLWGTWHWTKVDEVCFIPLFLFSPAVTWLPILGESKEKVKAKHKTMKKNGTPKMFFILFSLNETPSSTWLVFQAFIYIFRNFKYL